MSGITIVFALLCLFLLGWIITLKINNNKCQREYYTLKELQQEIVKLTQTKYTQQEELHNVEHNLFALKQQFDNTKQNLDDSIKTLNNLKETYSISEQFFKEEYKKEQEKWIEEQKDEYIKTQQEFAEQFVEENKKKLIAAKELDSVLTTLKQTINAATALQKKALQEENYAEFHSLQLDEQALFEMNKLREAVKGISPLAEVAINKVIWKVYLEKPYTDLVGRVLGQTNKTGIYKITNKQNQMCYVGQAVNVAERWKQHIKRAIGAEPMTNNKLYPAMKKFGVENFTFELIEECSQDKLNQREDYWQDFYNAKDYGYSIK